MDEQEQVITYFMSLSSYTVTHLLTSQTYNHPEHQPAPELDCPTSCRLTRPDVTPGTNLDVTCECGEAYYDDNGKWVRGIDVRAGKAPPKARDPER